MSTEVVGPAPARTGVKASHVPWIGDIPGHWSVVLLRLVARIESGHTPSRQHPEYWVPDECVIPWFSLADVWQLRDGNQKFLGETAECISELGIQNSSARLLPAGTVVLSRTASVGFSGIMPRPMATTQDFVNWVCGPRIVSDYLMWVFRAMKPEFKRLMMGSTHQTIYMPDVGQFRGPLPPVPEQRRIAAFLDRETARIDAVIQKKRRQVELLHEKRAALISQAITKGLDPSATMKRSGVDWLGDVPTHWTVLLLRLVARIESGHTPSRQHPEYWVPDECVIPWFSLADVWQLREGNQKYLGATAERISELGIEHSAARLLPAGTVVLSRTASVGFSGIMPRPMTTTQDFVNWVCGPRILPDYLMWMFRAMKPEFDRLMMGSTHQTIYMPELRQFRGPLPPLDEQRAIAAYLDRETVRIDHLVDHVALSIERLREYRAAVIAAAVTGKIDVSQEAA